MFYLPVTKIYLDLIYFLIGLNLSLSHFFLVLERTARVSSECWCAISE